MSDNNTSNNPFTQYQSYQNSSNVEYYDEEVKNIIKKARQNERYRLPIHVNHYKWGKDIRFYLPYFAGIGVEKLYLFYTHALDLFDDHDDSYVQIQIWKDMLMMVQDPVFVRKLRKLEKFTEDDFRKMNLFFRGFVMMDIMEYGQTMFGFDRKQLLYFIVDMSLNALNVFLTDKKRDDKTHMMIVKKYYGLKHMLVSQIFTEKQKWSEEDRLHALKTVYTRKVKIPNTSNIDNNTNINHDSFLYELDIEKLNYHVSIYLSVSDKRFGEVVMDNLKPLITMDEEIQTEEAN